MCILCKNGWRVDRKKILMASIAVNLILVIIFAVSFGRHATTIPEPSTKALARLMKPMQVDPSWIKSGSPKFMVAESVVINPPIGSLTAGLWSCDGPATFDWNYGVDETVHILEGMAQIEYLGETLILKAGDTAFFQAGTTATWIVPLRVSKSFVLHDPGLLSRMYRRVVDSLDLDN